MIIPAPRLDPKTGATVRTERTQLEDAHSSLDNIVQYQ
jgi:hypothetical protein